MKEGVKWSLYFSCMIFSFIVLLILIFVVAQLITFKDSFSEPLSGGYPRGYGVGIIGIYLILPLTFIVSGILYAIITRLNLTGTINISLILRTVVYVILGIICLWLFLITFLNN